MIALNVENSELGLRHFIPQLLIWKPCSNLWIIYAAIILKFYLLRRLETNAWQFGIFQY